MLNSAGTGVARPSTTQMALLSGVVVTFADVVTPLTESFSKAQTLAQDWIEAFMDYTGGLPSPAIFRLWAGISTLAGAQERRTRVMSAGRPIYPNLYVLLV